MDDWDDLLLTGGFAPRDVLLRGLTVDQVSVRLPNVPHSIYQELWHAATALHLSLEEGRAALEDWPYAEHFPEHTAPPSQQAWEQLVAGFLEDLRRAVEQARDPAWLTSSEPVYVGSTWRDALAFLAVHTAYHLGRIVLLRQLLGCWPPPAQSTTAPVSHPT